MNAQPGLGPVPLPMAVERCGLDEAQLQVQMRRYARIGQRASPISRTPMRIVLRLAPELDARAVAETVDVEQQCCPFFELDWQPDTRILVLAVSAPDDEPALGALAQALGLDHAA